MFCFVYTFMFTVEHQVALNDPSGFQAAVVYKTRKLVQALFQTALDQELGAIVTGRLIGAQVEVKADVIGDTVFVQVLVELPVTLEHSPGLLVREAEGLDITWGQLIVNEYMSSRLISGYYSILN